MDARLLPLLVCPKCRTRLLPVEGREVLLCPRCDLRYPVIGGVPVLLRGEARPVEPNP